MRECHRIVTIEAGEVVEQGSHDELIKTDGRYAKLWNMQMKGRGVVTRHLRPSPPRPCKGEVTRNADGQLVVRRPVPLKGIQAKGGKAS